MNSIPIPKQLKIGRISKQKSYFTQSSVLILVNPLSAISNNQRLRTALGGFISFTGFVILITVILAATRIVDIESVFQSEMIVGVVAFLALLDVFCGILLVFRETNLKGLFTPKKNKPNKDVD